MGIDLEYIVDGMANDIKRQVKERGVRASNELRNAALEVLKSEGHGRVYKRPNTYSKRADKVTKQLLPEYGHKLRRGQLYRASAPGETPAKRTGSFRTSWKPKTKIEGGAGLTVIASIESGYSAGGYTLGKLLEDGTSKMAPRPHHDKIREEARPKIERIFNEPYLS
ncbi:MAG: hypothetical protein HFE90_09280 [Firmicutes bacterium]|nr:hypothetical protein [Bacillota bacterium]